MSRKDICIRRLRWWCSVIQEICVKLRTNNDIGNYIFEIDTYKTSWPILHNNNLAGTFNHFTTEANIFTS